MGTITAEQVEHLWLLVDSWEHRSKSEVYNIETRVTYEECAHNLRKALDGYEIEETTEVPNS